uniref:GTx7-1 n=1 Tax=Grammostola rosea TaxID=432528 RepID=M5AYA5_GRARO|nr:GTx7-1 [Grammostola rosea]
MKTSVFAAILGLALFAVLCSGSELQEKDLKETLLSAIMETALEAQPEERKILEKCGISAEYLSCIGLISTH